MNFLNKSIKIFVLTFFLGTMSCQHSESSTKTQSQSKKQKNTVKKTSTNQKKSKSKVQKSKSKPKPAPIPNPIPDPKPEPDPKPDPKPDPEKRTEAVIVKEANAEFDAVALLVQPATKQKVQSYNRQNAYRESYIQEKKDDPNFQVVGDENLAILAKCSDSNIMYANAVAPVENIVRAIIRDYKSKTKT